MAEDELALRRQTDRAAKAAALANDPLLVEAFDAIERDLMTAWANSAPVDASGREKVWNMHWATQKLRSSLQQIIQDGKVAQGTLNMIAAKNKGKAA